MAHYVPHTDEEVDSMLAFIGLDSTDQLFEMVPSAMRLAGGLTLADGRSEYDTAAEMERLGAANRSDLVCFAGGGAYDHDIPAVTRRLAGRTEFVTSYTPYQAEVAQGVLQALFEYQSLVARLAGLEVANASLYDGGTSCVEAVNLAVAATGKAGVLLSHGVNPLWRQVIATMAVGTGHDLRTVDLDGGVTNWASFDGLDEVGAVVVQYPNYLGCLEDIAPARQLADRLGAHLVVAFDPVAAVVLQSPGQLGADIAIGEGQSFGTPLSLGGPYLGLFACNLSDVRRLPGRLVGETVDNAGNRAYTTTLRTREQDIRREKASSNVCTNQTLIAVTAAIQLSWLGTNGLREMALRCARGTRYLRQSVVAIEGVELATTAPTFREFSVTTPLPAPLIVERMIDRGYLAGVSLEDLPEYRGDLLLSATEKRTKAEIDGFVAALSEVLA